MTLCVEDERIPSDASKEVSKQQPNPYVLGLEVMTVLALSAMRKVIKDESTDHRVEETGCWKKKKR